MAGEKLPMAKVKMPAEICSYVDEEQMTLHLEISVPGVKKEDVKLKMHDESLNLSALRADFDYTATMAFCCPVRAKDAKAEYRDGLLKIEVPFKDPMEGAVEVSIE